MMHSLYGSLCPDPLAAAVALMDPSLTAAAAAAKDTTFTKIFVGGLPYHTTDKTLREYFEQYGEIEEAVVITDRQTGKSRGYGFVTMKERTGAERACKDPNPIIDGRKANVNLAYLGAKPRNNLQLTGLPLPLQASIPTLLPGRIGLPHLYYSTAPLLTSQGLVPVSSLTSTAAVAANHAAYLDYSTAAAAAAAYGGGQLPGTAAAAAAAAAAAYEPLSYAAAAYGMVPAAAAYGTGGAYGTAQGMAAGANALAAQAAAYQAAAAAAANGLQGINGERQ